ncbi:lysophosphatidic acid receptor 6-like [Alosa sapidissima]|uniref:lysophosphatidic acid receptor 6-like n=1 Tax=Alosa sapidissima TaxID=34773 RepID=UPI001C0999FB|nr:lysophosphatidic acid receptor 6-like [Alosa sapidissima]
MNDTFDPFCTDLLVGPLVWATFSVPAACVGVPASMWLLWALIQRQRSRSSNTVYMLNLTIMDLGFNLLIIPNVLNYLIWRDAIFNSVAVFSYAFNLCGRPLFMSCICVDCYMAVIHPITYMQMKDGIYRIIICALVWVFTLVYGYLLGLKTYVILVILAFTAPVIAYCDLSILHTLRKPDPSRRSDIHPQKQRALQTITNSLVMTLVSYLPLMILIAVQSLIVLSPTEFICHVAIPCVIAATVGSTIMPLLNLWQMGCTRKE